MNTLTGWSCARCDHNEHRHNHPTQDRYQQAVRTHILQHLEAIERALT